MNYQEISKKLVPGKKYTLVAMSEFGFPYKVHMTLVEAKVEPYAQYKESLVIYFKKARGRRVYGVRFYGIKEFLIWEGFVNPDTNMYGQVEDRGDGVIVKTSRYRCFDSRYLYDAIESMKTKPVVAYGI